MTRQLLRGVILMFDDQDALGTDRAWHVGVELSDHKKQPGKLAWIDPGDLTSRVSDDGLDCPSLRVDVASVADAQQVLEAVSRAMTTYRDR